MALIRLLVNKLDIPVVAAGGIMDGSGIAAALTLGAAASQLGTAFIACPESSADAAYRTALLGPLAGHTVMTSAISGRPAPQGTKILHAFCEADNWLPVIGAKMVFVLRSSPGAAVKRPESSASIGSKSSGHRSVRTGSD